MPSTDPAMQAVLLVEPDRQSYRIIGSHLARTFEAAGLRIEERVLPRDRADRQALSREVAGSVLFHNTIGPLFVPVAGCVNVALPLHEWSRYPRGWVQRLNAFDAVWSSSRFVAGVLRASGVSAPLSFVPPALDREELPAKTDWSSGAPFRFLACGEAHFRKGFHLLIAGFLEAFPEPGVATLTIKTTPGCTWASPRGDILIIAKNLPRRKLLALYQQHDALVSATLGEGVDLPVAEAILAGLPVVSHRWSGHQDLLTRDGCIEMRHRLIPQPFASQPSYYAPDQRCAYASPTNIANALRRAIAMSARERRDTATRARCHLLATFGTEPASRRLRAAWRQLPLA